MPVKHVREIHPSRLREELRALGMDARGPREELIESLHKAGIYTLNDSLHARPKKYANSENFPDHENVCIGAGAYELLCANKEELIICNAPRTQPLITGDFIDQSVCINNCLQLKESNVDAELFGEEGDIRRSGSTLYMYRSTGVHPGWYPLQFGSVVVV